MAYKCELVCDMCGDSTITVLNKTWAKTKMERVARQNGWKHRRAKGGWICPVCWDELKEKSKPLE